MLSGSRRKGLEGSPWMGKAKEKAETGSGRASCAPLCRQTYQHHSNTLKQVWEGPSGRRFIDLFAEGGEGAIRATGRERPGAAKRTGAGEFPPPCPVPAHAGS